MARPRRSGIYPADDEVGADIQQALKEGRYRSKTAAIKANLDRLEGPSEDAKMRRMLRWLRSSEEEERSSEDVFDWQELGRSLAGLSNHEKASILAKLAKSQEKLALDYNTIQMGMIAQGARLTPDLAKALGLALLLESSGAPETDTNRQKLTKTDTK